jgi:LuxR family transcriptional regulator, maltose regulon positive regulatory protein
VTVTPAGSATAAAPLVLSKFEIPRSRLGIVRRDGLLARLQVADGTPIISVVAPGGYGKTTLLSQWASEGDGSFAWLTLDSGDNDVVVLARYVEASLISAGVLTDVPRRAITDALPEATVLARLRRMVSAVEVPFVLVLDDVHELTTRDAQDLVELLFRSLPPHGRIALSGRSELAVVIAAARASRQVLELRAGDLALSRDEGRELLAAVNPDIPPDAADVSIRETEGWPAGLYLVALAGVPVPAGAGAGGPEANRFVEDYLWTQHLDALPEERLSFLVQSSVLDRMCADLCNAALGRTGSARVLGEIEQSNLFFVPLDQKREWYRYHELFRAVLLHELERRDPDAPATLRSAASDWCLAHDMAEDAMSYAIAAGDTDRMARIVAVNAIPYFRAGRLRTLSGWFDLFDDGPMLSRYPVVAVLGSLLQAFLGRPFQAERWLDAAAYAADSAPPPPDGSASLASWVSTVAAILCRHGPERMRDDAEAALEHLSPVSPLLGPAVWTHATALQLLGDERAGERLEEAMERAQVGGGAFAAVNAAAQLALLALERDDLSAADEYCLRFRELLGQEAFVDYIAIALPLVAVAKTKIAAGEPDEARRLLAALQRVRPGLSHALPYIAVQALVEGAGAYLDLDDAAAARALSHDAQEILRHRPGLGRLNDDAERLRLRLSSAGAGSGAGSGLTAAELRLLPYLTTHLSFRQIGERLFLSRNTIKSQAISLYRKLGSNSRAEAVNRAAELGLIDHELGGV